MCRKALVFTLDPRGIGDDSGQLRDLREAILSRGAAGSGCDSMSRSLGSEWYQLQLGTDSPEIRGVAGHDGLACPPCANDHVGIDDVRCSGFRQQLADSGRFQTVECNEVRAGLSHETAEACLPGRVPNGLCKRRRWNGNTHSPLGRTCQKGDRPAIVPVQGDQTACVESDTAHAAFPLDEPFLRLAGERTASAQVRSFFVSGPPVC
jgi:hypothetical protein